MHRIITIAVIALALVTCTNKHEGSRGTKDTGQSPTDTTDWEIDTYGIAETPSTNEDSEAEDPDIDKQGVHVEQVCEDFHPEETIENCIKVSHGDEVKLWSSDGRYYVYGDDRLRLHLVDTEKNKRVILTSPFKDEAFGMDALKKTHSGHMYLHEGSIYMMLWSIEGGLKVSRFVKYDIEKSVYSTLSKSSAAYDYDVNNPASGVVDYYYPIVDGNYAVFGDGCDVDPYTPYLCLFDMNTKKKKMIVKTGGAFKFRGNIIVWPEEGGERYRWYPRAYDIEKGTFLEINRDDNYWQAWPETDGKKIVYQDLRYGSNDIDGSWGHSVVMLYDLETGKTQQVTDKENTSIYPQVQDDMVIWFDYRNASNPYDALAQTGVEIRMKNMKTGEEKTLVKIHDKWKQDLLVHEGSISLLAGKGWRHGIYHCDTPDLGDK
jgi:hypothetical protein